MMEKETKEIIKLTTRQILYLVENGLDRVAGIFDFSVQYKTIFGNDYQPTTHQIDWRDFKRKIQRLKDRGLIRKFSENKIYHLEITSQGREFLSRRQLDQIAISHPKRWDKKWRIVIYDIKEDDHEIRNIIRRKLYQLGFQQIQKSVFVYPFECSKEIDQICKLYGERSSFKYMIADIIEGEESIIEVFIDNKTLKLSDLA